MSNLFRYHIVCFPTRWLNFIAYKFNECTDFGYNVSTMIISHVKYFLLYESHDLGCLCYKMGAQAPGRLKTICWQIGKEASKKLIRKRKENSRWEKELYKVSFFFKFLVLDVRFIY